MVKWQALQLQIHSHLLEEHKLILHTSTLVDFIFISDTNDGRISWWEMSVGVNYCRSAVVFKDVTCFLCWYELTCSWSPLPVPACFSALPPAWSSHFRAHPAVCAGWQCRPRTWHRCWSGWWSVPAAGSTWSPAFCSAAPGSEPKR